MADKIWEITNKSKVQSVKDIENALLENRGIKTAKQKQEFFNPIDPLEIAIEQTGIKKFEIEKAIKRLSQAKSKKEEIIIYGDYDADGICATAILWETLHKLKFKVMPFIPNRFDDGYGINAKSIENLKSQNPKLKLIITVDNGIVAYDGLQKANELGVDVIVTDHHSKDRKKINVIAAIHTTKICGSAVAWFFSREINKKSVPSLELAAIGTIADQMPLLGINRSIAKFGIASLQNTKRLGLKKICESAAINLQNIGVYEIGFVISPRINAMGRLGEGMDSLRLLCTPNTDRASQLAALMQKTNQTRQKIVEEAVVHAQSIAVSSNTKGVLLLSHESYHEGVIGLAASRLVEAYHRPAIVISIGEKISKGSARSISGINITSILREFTNLMVNLGGHEMAAGFSIETKNLEIFSKELEKMTAKLITTDLMNKKLSIDLLLGFELIDWELVKNLKAFEPTGNSNPEPLFATYKVKVIDKKIIGSSREHLKLKLKHKQFIFDAIAFKMSAKFDEIGENIDVAYNIQSNVWNNVESLQLKIKDIK